jgi:D-cysteine desulfhydrase
LLDDLLGARRLSFPEGENEPAADQSLRDEADRLRRAGRRPYVIPLGIDNPPLGALGYMLAAKEVIEQATLQGIAFDCVVVASGSALTHTGLLCGLRALRCRVPVHGACVRRPADAQRDRVTTVAANLARLLGTPPLLGNDDVVTWDMALAPGYGRLGPLAREAIELMARTEGLFVDPVYTAKSLAVLIALVRDGTIARDQRVLFIHTGGLPALFGYTDELTAVGAEA